MANESQAGLEVSGATEQEMAFDALLLAFRERDVSYNGATLCADGSITLSLGRSAAMRLAEVVAPAIIAEFTRALTGNLQESK